MHIEHYKMADAKRLVNEWERDDKYQCRDGRIDAARTPANYQLGGSVVLEQVLTGRLNEVRHANRKDLNVLSDWVVTCPKELVGDAAKERKFFELTYKFMQDRYGPENVLQGYVHMDETTPHAHIPLVPVMKDAEKGDHVSSKALFPRAELRDIHKDLDAVMEREFGQKGLVKNGRTKGNFTVKELKERDRQEKAYEGLQAEVATTAQRYLSLKTAQEAVESDLSELSRKAGEVSQSLKKAAEGPLSASEADVIAYLKVCKRQDGKTAYEHYSEKAAEYKRKQLRRDAAAASKVQEKAKPQTAPQRSAQSKQLREASTVDEILAAVGCAVAPTLRTVSSGQENVPQRQVGE